MKKILSLVLVLSMVLGSFGFAFAGNVSADQQAAGEILKELGVLTGVNAEGELGLEDSLLRKDMVVLLSRLFNVEEEVKGSDNVSTFTDVPEGFYAPYVAWAQEEGLVEGKGNNLFGFKDELTVREFVTVILRALGHDKAVAWNHAAEVAADFTAAGLTDVATRGIMAEITEIALYMPMANGEMSLGTKLGFEGYELEVAELAIEAKAVKANEVEVTFNQAVESATLTVKRGAFKVNASEIVWNDAKTVATIKTVNPMTAGDYTVTAAAGEETATAEFKVETQKVTAIEFTSNKAVLGSKVDAGNLVADTSYVTIGYKLVDQYGTDVTNARDAEIDWTTTTGTIVETADGVVKVALTTPAAFAIEQKLIVNGLNKNTGVFASETFTVSQMAYVADVQFGEVTVNATADDTVVYTNNVANFHIPVKAFDQYGNPMKNAALVNANLLPLHVNVNATLVAVDGELRVNLASVDTPIPGDAHITFVGKSSGARFATTFKMNKPVTITEFSMEMPALIVAKDAKAVEVPFVALDQYGAPVTDLTALNTLAGTFSITADKGTFSFAKDYKTNTIKLLLDVSAATDGKAYVTLVTPGHKFFQTSYDVQLAAKPVIVSNTNELIANVVKGSNLATIKATNLVVLDQYGREMSFDALPTGYDVRLEASTPGSITLTGTTFDAKADVATVTTVKTGATTVKATIYKTDAVAGTTTAVADSALSFTMNVVEAKDVVSYEIADVPTIQAGKTATMVVTGKLANGNKVVLNTNVIKQIVDNSDAISVDKTTRVVTAAGTPDDTTKDITSQVIVTIEGPNGAILVTKNVTVSFATSVAATITVDEVTYITVTEAKDLANLRAAFEVEDQFGADYAGAYTLVITNASNANYSLADVTTAAAGDTFNLIFIGANGKTATTKVVVIQD